MLFLCLSNVFGWGGDCFLDANNLYLLIKRFILIFATVAPPNCCFLCSAVPHTEHRHLAVTSHRGSEVRRG